MHVSVIIYLQHQFCAFVYGEQREEKTKSEPQHHAGTTQDLQLRGDDL